MVAHEPIEYEQGSNCSGRLVLVFVAGTERLREKMAALGRWT